MYLLIPCLAALYITTLSHLHPTMYLLIPFPLCSFQRAILTFTSHYVSINSGNVIKDAGYSVYLHPTMYLLIRRLELKARHSDSIYIPLCIY